MFQAWLIQKKMKTLLKNIIDIYVWIERIQNIAGTITPFLSRFFSLFISK